MSKRKSAPRRSSGTKKPASKPGRPGVSRRAGGTRRPGGSVGRGTAKKRVRPSVKARARKSKIKSNPLPKAPPRRGISTQSSATSSPFKTQPVESGGENIQAAFSQLQSQFSRLEGAAQLPDIYDAIGDIDQQLVQLPITLETLRSRGYVHSGFIEDELEAIDDQWDEIRPQIEQTLRQHIRQLDGEMDAVERRFNAMGNRLNASNIRSVETAVGSLEQKIGAARSALSGLFSGLDNKLDQIAYQLRHFDQMLDQIDGSPAIHMQEAEAPLLLVEAEWQPDGEEGPDGILLLTDQRLLFEQREEVVTKRRFGLFKAESEMVQELKLNISIHHIDQVEHEKAGGFLGIGKEDVLRIVCSASAQISRAQFHLNGQRSEDWAKMIKRVKSGEIDKDRADDYLDEIEAAEETAAAFPEHCPGCFARIPSQPRGITSYLCQFCSLSIDPAAPEPSA